MIKEVLRSIHRPLADIAGPSSASEVFLESTEFRSVISSNYAIARIRDRKRVR